MERQRRWSYQVASLPMRHCGIAPASWSLHIYFHGLYEIGVNGRTMYGRPQDDGYPSAVKMHSASLWTWTLTSDLEKLFSNAARMVNICAKFRWNICFAWCVLGGGISTKPEIPPPTTHHAKQVLTYNGRPDDISENTYCLHHKFFNSGAKKTINA